MNNQNFILNLQFFAFSQAISVMRMLADQAEKNVTLAVNEADKPGAVTAEEYEEEVCDQYGESYPYPYTYYSCGSSVGNDQDEVKSAHKHLITQLTRRSAYLTIYGLFEHRMRNILELMIGLTKYEKEIKVMGPIEKAHTILKKAIGGKDIADVDHLTVIRNIMSHSDGIAKDYNNTLTRKDKKTPSENRLLKAIRRTEGVGVNYFNEVIMDSDFLVYTVNEFNRYITSLEAAVETYQIEQAHESGVNAE